MWLLLSPSWLYKHVGIIKRKYQRGQPISFTDFFGYLVGDVILKKVGSLTTYTYYPSKYGPSHAATRSPARVVSMSHLPTYLPTYLPTPPTYQYLPTFLPTYLLACACLPVCLPTYLYICLPTYLLTCLPACLHAYLLASLLAYSLACTLACLLTYFVIP